MNTNLKNLKRLYRISKTARVGEMVICPSCSVSFEKTNYQQVFCKSLNGTVCKDHYWNNVTPTKRNNTTRISPANARFMEENGIGEEKFNDFDDDQSWDAHKDY